MDWNNINTDRDTSGLGPIEYDQSKVPALIRKHADNVRTKTYGQEVRESLARGVEYAGLVSSEATKTAQDTKNRQDVLETYNDQVIAEITDKDIVSAPEIIAARDGEATLNDRLISDKSKVLPITLNVKQPPAGLTPMVGDGVTDDYDAYMAIVAYINARANVGGVVYFPKGTYLIDRYKIVGGENANSLTDPVFKDLRNWSFIGHRAVIKCKGDFTRTYDYDVDTSKRSYRLGVTPLCFEDCDNTYLEGISADGSVYDMKKDNGVAEGYNFGLRLNGVRNFVAKDCNFSNFHQDGIGIVCSFTRKNNGFNEPCRNVYMENVKAIGNARQGMTIGNLHGGRFKNCAFNRTGQTGDYGYHLPISGVDLENDYADITNPAEPTQNVIFDDCEFLDNLTTFYIHDNNVKDIIVDGCIMKSTVSAGYNDESIRLNGKKLIFTNNVVDVDKNINVGGMYEGMEQDIILSGNHINANRFICHSSFGGIPSVKRMLFRDNRFILNQFYAYQSRALSLTSNQIEIKESSKYTDTNHAINLNSIWISANNDFYTNKKTGMFIVLYGLTPVDSDVYKTRERLRPEGEINLGTVFYGKG